MLPSCARNPKSYRVDNLNRRKREQILSTSEYARVKRQLAVDVVDADLVNLKTGVSAKSVQLLEGSQLRAMDALHAVSALSWEADLFASSNRRQLAAAGEAGPVVREV